MIAKALILLVALEHLYILWIEMFAWETVGKKTFNSIPADLFEKTKVLAANQGLYNGFLAGGLLWALTIQETVWSENIALFFLTCVVIAGIYGGMTASKSIVMKQAFPALVAAIVVLIN